MTRTPLHILPFAPALILAVLVIDGLSVVAGFVFGIFMSVAK
jgi:hypothetical protein